MPGHPGGPPDSGPEALRGAALGEAQLRLAHSSQMAPSLPPSPGPGKEPFRKVWIILAAASQKKSLHFELDSL